MTEFLTTTQLKNLQAHKYCSEGKSYMEMVMNPFWVKLVDSTPMWWNANCMTTAGLALNIIASIILCFYSPDCLQNPPAWAFILAIVNLYLFQTLDAMDGKQARRTGTSSPLGELCDHGCDCITTGCVAVSVAVSMKLGEENGTFALVYIMSWFFLYYCAHWQTYCSGKLLFSSFDVTECQYIMMGVFLVAAIGTPDIFSQVVFGMTLRRSFIIGGFLGAIWYFSKTFKLILRGGVGKRGSTVANSSILFPAAPLLETFALVYAMHAWSNEDLLQENMCVFLYLLGIVAAKITMRLIIGHMSRSELDYIDSIFIGPLFVLFFQYFSGLIPEWLTLYIALCYCLLDLGKYCVMISRQLADFLEIYVFSNAVPPGASRKPAPSSTRTRSSKH